MHWMLIDLARRVRPELDESRGRLRCADWQSEQCPLMSMVSKFNRSRRPVRAPETFGLSAPVLITQHAVDTASSD